MVVRVDAGVDLRAPAFEIFVWVHGVCVEDASELDFKLDGTVLVEDPVDAVLVICSSEDVRDDESAAPSHYHRIVSEISVFEEDTGVFFVDADCVLDGVWGAGFIDEGGVDVVDCAFAIAAQSETVGHVPTAVFTEVEGMFALMRVFRVAVGDDHLGEGETVEEGPDRAVVVVGYVV